ncbi:unnamed protein product, partial [Vitis vinifera]|uniref:Uncharacterized protein n=1 Tax=Vitis vinifera TaxID=29760 RepID=D7SYY1_VITVI
MYKLVICIDFYESESIYLRSTVVRSNTFYLKSSLLKGSM